MTKREALEAQYEDALFALMMDEVARREGTRALEENAALLKDPAAAVPEPAARRCIQAVERRFSAQSLRGAGRTAKRLFTRVAVAATLAVLTAITAFAANEDFRVNTLNLMIEAGDVATRLTMTGEGGNSGATPSAGSTAPTDGPTFYGYHLSYVPEGFTISEEGETADYSWMEYMNSEGKTIYFQAGVGSNSVYNVDTEDAQSVTDMQLFGYNGLLIEKGNRIHAIWADTKQNVFINFICTGFSNEEATSLLNSIEFVEIDEN